jgi:hypothetical protein
MGWIAFDIETGPLPLDDLREQFEVDLSKVKGRELIGQEFDLSTVKLGRMKDQAKIDAKIDDERQKFERAQADAVAALAGAESEQWTEFVEKAPLSPTTGTVLAIGYLGSNGQQVLSGSDGEDEPTILREFWGNVERCLAGKHLMIGFNIYGFDLPFLIRRSWKHGIRVPEGVTERNGRYFSPMFVDLLAHWGVGDNRRISLDRLCQFLGIRGKAVVSDEQGKALSGGDFHKLWNGSVELRQLACDYLANDLRMTKEAGERMGWC